jgi:ribosome-binding factor A
MPSLRHQRVRELLKRALGEIIRREIPLDEAGLITVNEIGLAADLQSATVFIGTVGKPEQRKKAELLLNQERKRLQGLVGQATVLKYTPQLKFVMDDSIEQGNRVIAIIEEIEKSSPGT